MLSVLLSALFSCNILNKKQNPIKIAILSTVDCFPLYKAWQLGRFKKAGLEIEFTLLKSAQERDTLLASKAVDGASGDLVGASLMRARGLDVKVLALTLGSDKDRKGVSLLLAPGVKNDSMLQGNSIAISKNSVIEYLADRLLAKAQIPLDWLEKVHIANFGLRLSLLTSGKVKVTVLPDPLAQVAVSKGASVLIEDKRSQYSHAILLFQEPYIKDNVATVKNLLEILSQVTHEINADLEAVKKEIIDFCKMPEELAQNYQVSKFSERSLPAKSLVADVQDWLIQNKRVEQKISYLDLCSERFGFIPNEDFELINAKAAFRN